jgi:hypothetical protein
MAMVMGNLTKIVRQEISCLPYSFLVGTSHQESHVEEINNHGKRVSVFHLLD